MMLRIGYDVKTVAKLGGWRETATVLKYCAHARDDLTLTDGHFDTNLTQGRSMQAVSYEFQMSILK